MPCVWARNSAVTPIMQRALARALEELGIEVEAVVHRQVLHVLQAADDLHVFEAGGDRVRRLVERLQAAAAEAIDRRPAASRPAGRPSGRSRGPR